MFSNAMVAIDIERESGAEPVLRAAEHFAQKEGARLHFVSVQTDDSEYSPYEFREALANVVLDFRERTGIEAKWTSVLDQDVDAGLTATVEEVKPDLVIIGAHEGGWLEWFMGPTIRDFAANCEASLLIIR